jgi:hypothetical protein
MGSVVDFNMKKDEEIKTAMESLETFLVLGLDASGELFVASNIERPQDINWLIDMFKTELLMGDFDAED